MIFGNPVTMDASGTKLWVPTQYDAEAVKSVASTLLRQAVGPEPDDGDGQALGAAPANSLLPATRTIRGVPLDRRGLGQQLLRAGATVGEPESANNKVQAAQGQEGPATSGVPLEIPFPPPRRPRMGEIGGPQVEAGKTLTIRTSEPKPPAVQPQSVIEALQNDEFSQAWLDQLATTWETSGKRFNGYGTSLADINKKGVKGYALGRYQLRRPGLIEAGMMAPNEEWTARYGIKNWQDFLNNPLAQEAAVRNLLRANEGYMHRSHSQHIGRIIKSVEGDITVTEGGFLAACHKAGTGTMRAYFRWVESNGWDTRGKALPDDFKEIEPRMKQFENTPHRKP